MGDNGAMIAYTGQLMLEAGAVIPVEASAVNPHFRSDQVDAVWRTDTGGFFAPGQSEVSERGAEAFLDLSGGDARKVRLSKGYRQPQLDADLLCMRTRTEARCIAAARRGGVPTPVIRDVTDTEIVMEKLCGDVVKYIIDEEIAKEAGKTVGKLHKAGIVHGDLTTSNMILQWDKLYLLDFGLSQMTDELEPRGVDLHVLFQTLFSTTQNPEELKAAFTEGYCSVFDGAGDVLRREHEIELRGRYL
jgi:N6-L-threonylcarbamoyladenine synthase/protein kinase Bud32